MTAQDDGKLLLECGAISCAKDVSLFRDMPSGMMGQSVSLEYSAYRDINNTIKQAERA